MNEVLMLRESKPQTILQKVINRNISINLSYLHEHRWQEVLVKGVDLADDIFEVEFPLSKQSHFANLAVGQNLGISFCNEQTKDRYVFNSSVVQLKFSCDFQAVLIAVPEQIELVQKSCYTRVSVPEGMDIKVDISRSSYLGKEGRGSSHSQQGWQGRLMDVCAGGVRVYVDSLQGPDLDVGQFVRIGFAPMENETPLRFDAYVKNARSSDDQQGMLYGLQTVGLEASPEGRMVLQRLCNTAWRYDQQSISEFNRNIQSLFFD